MRTDMAAQLLNVRVETKTEDNVFVQVVLAVHCYPLSAHGGDTFEDASRHISAAIREAVDARIPEMTIDDILKKKSEIADIVRREVTPRMRGFGYGLLKALVNDIRMQRWRDRWPFRRPGVHSASRARMTDETFARRWAAIVQDETL